MVNLLKRKKKPSITAGETSNYDDQPWVTAHLGQPNSTASAAEITTTTTMPPHTSSRLPPVPSQNQQHDNTNTDAAEDVDAITPLPDREVYIDPIAGHSNVTILARPRRTHTLSELFDVSDLPTGTTVRSPSGNLLSAEQAATREDRPMGIRERQEIIRRRVAEQRAHGFGNETTIVGDVRGKERREGERGESTKSDKVKKAWSDCRCQ